MVENTVYRYKTIMGRDMRSRGRGNEWRYSYTARFSTEWCCLECPTATRWLDLLPATGNLPTFRAMHQGRLTPSGEEKIERWIAECRFENFGFARVERLVGNVGYLDLRSFVPSEWAAAAWGFIFLLPASAILPHTSPLCWRTLSCLRASEASPRKAGGLGYRPHEIQPRQAPSYSPPERCARTVHEPAAS